ncbi:MAG: SocA family protein, partial [SAR324 cluster bacterium]|nr:SocA family protein [SAR324 cluster bacterium]
EKYISTVPPDITIFTPGELDVLNLVKRRLSNLGAKEIADRSHCEPAWKNTAEKAPISYNYAKDLTI